MTETAAAEAAEAEAIDEDRDRAVGSGDVALEHIDVEGDLIAVDTHSGFRAR